MTDNLARRPASEEVFPSIFLPARWHLTEVPYLTPKNCSFLSVSFYWSQLVTFQGHKRAKGRCLRIVFSTPLLAALCWQHQCFSMHPVIPSITMTFHSSLPYSISPSPVPVPSDEYERQAVDNFLPSLALSLFSMYYLCPSVYLVFANKHFLCYSSVICFITIFFFLNATYRHGRSALRNNERWTCCVGFCAEENIHTTFFLKETTDMNMNVFRKVRKVFLSQVISVLQKEAALSCLPRRKPWILHVAFCSSNTGCEHRENTW